MGVAVGPSRLDAIQRAIGHCRLGLAKSEASGCRCRLLALDDRLLAPLEAFAYAPGTTGRLLGLGANYAGPLVVREDVAGPQPGDSRLSFETADGVVATAVLSSDGTATLDLASDGSRFVGERELKGWRRGRLTERLLLRGPHNRRLIALIGYEPAEFVRNGPALASWPQGAPG